MRLKPLPPPPNALEAIRDARRAIPLVPSSEMDCCARVMDRLEIDDRPTAREWVTLLRALGLVTETDAGYARTRDDVEDQALAVAFVGSVYGAREVLAAVGDEPRSPDEVFARIEGVVPAWERDKYAGTWRDVWRERTADVLGWLALFGLVESEEGGYVRTGFVPAERSEE